MEKKDALKIINGVLTQYGIEKIEVEEFDNLMEKLNRPGDPVKLQQSLDDLLRRIEAHECKMEVHIS